MGSLATNVLPPHPLAPSADAVPGHTLTAATPSPRPW